MKVTMKNIFLFICITMMVAMASCSKKENTNPISRNSALHDSIVHDSVVVQPFHEYRDSLVGTYNCMEYYSYTFYQGFPMQNDTLLGPASIIVSKPSNSDSSILIQGTSFYFYSSSSQTITFWEFPVSANGNPDFAYFSKSNSSLWFSNTQNRGVSHWDYYYYTGHKQ